MGKILAAHAPQLWEVSESSGKHEGLLWRAGPLRLNLKRQVVKPRGRSRWILISAVV